MGRRKQTGGNCGYWQREMTQGGLTRHLESCGHLSASTIGDTSYTQILEDGFGWENKVLAVRTGRPMTAFPMALMARNQAREVAAIPNLAFRGEKDGIFFAKNVGS